MGISVSQMIKLSAFGPFPVIAGEKGITRIVDGVTLIEDLGSEKESIKNELILCHIHLLESSGKNPASLIWECRRKGASALCIKRGSPDQTISPELLNAADTADFPVLLLPPETSFSRIIHVVTYEILRYDGYNMRLTFEENCFQDIIFNFKDRDNLFKKISMLGIKMDMRLALFLIEPENPRVIPDVRSYCQGEWAEKCYTISRNGRILVIVEVSVLSNIKEHLVALASDLVQRLGHAFPGGAFRLGIGRCYEDMTALNKSFYEARAALTMNLINRSENPVTHFNDLGIYRILFDLKNKRELYQFYKETAGVIMDYDKANNTEYFITIRTYMDQNYSTNNTAQKLFVHYNTIRYRLAKIKALFGADMDDEEDRINLYMAVKISDFLAEDRNLPEQP